MATPPEVESILITREQIAKRVAELGREISRDYAGREILLVGVLKGAVVFLSDLMRVLTVPHRFDLVRASSYGDEATSSGRVDLSVVNRDAVEGQDVLVVEDIIDTGHTTSAIVNQMAELGAASVELCAMLSKPSRRLVEIDARYVGFEVPDEFVIGYGLDYAERFRGLPYVAILKRSIYE